MSADSPPRAPRNPRFPIPGGTGLRARGWRQEGLLRLLENVLCVGEDPDNLVVYAALGKATRNWAAHDAIVSTLRTMDEGETLVIQSGKPIGLLSTHATAPLVIMTNCNIVGQWAKASTFYQLEKKGLICWGGLTAGAWRYIGSQGVLQGAYEIFMRVAERRFGGDLRGRFVLTAGLGGMGGSQPLAGRMAGAAILCVEVDPERARKRHEVGCLEEIAPDLDSAPAMIAKACAAKAPISVALVANAAGLAPIHLKPKDGLATVSSNAIGFAAACHALRRGAGALRTLMASGLAAASAMGASAAPWRAAMAVGTPSQAKVAAWLVEGAEKGGVAADKAIHDPLSLRMMAQVFAAAMDALESAVRTALATTALVDDNPTVDGGRILASGGSLPLDIAIALQSTGLAFAHLARNSFNRCALISNGRRRRLPANLVARDATATGFGPVTKLAGELFVRTLSLAPPISAQSLVVSDGLEDEAAFPPLVVERSERQVEAIRRLAAPEGLFAAQALDLMGDRPSGVVARVYEIVRGHSAFYGGDRRLSAEVESIEKALASPSAMTRLLESAPLENFNSTFSLDL